MTQLLGPFRLTACCLWLVIIGGQAVPIPVVSRDQTQSSTIFTRPALVVSMSVLEKRLAEERNGDGESFTPPRLHRLVTAELKAVIRTNERSPLHSDLAGRQFILEMGDSSVELAFGKTYVLMLNYPSPAQGLHLVSGSQPPVYVLALKDVGFESDGSRVHVLRRGGELSAYDGRLTSEVLAAIERGR